MIDRRTVLKALAALPAGTASAVLAQAKSIPVIGFLNNQSAAQWKHLLAGFHQGLAEAGFVEGQNVAIDYRWAEGRPEQLPGLAGELAARKADVIFACGGIDSVMAAKAASETLPMVFIMGPDPVKHGLVESLARPGGRMTGFTLFTDVLGPKRLELLRELAPGTGPIGILVSPVTPTLEQQLRDLEIAAQALAIPLHVEQARDMAQITSAFGAMKSARVRALFVGSEAYYYARRAEITELAASHNLPAIFEERAFAEAGGLISYGVSFPDVYRQAGLYTARILRGAKPADLPVVQPSRFELVLNLKAAKALGLTFPPTLLALANEVIE
jgi:putative tryptophan/tyrosine transport system substrate-binding protein